MRRKGTATARTECSNTRAGLTSLRPRSDLRATVALPTQRGIGSHHLHRVPGGGGGEQWLCVAGGGPESRGVDEHPSAVGIRAFCPTPVGVVPLRTVRE